MTERYLSTHLADPQGPGDSRPTALQIIRDAQLEGKWTDKTILITGCSSGLGIETARALLETGATLYLTARDHQKAESALGDIVKSPRVHLLDLDLNSLASVRQCADMLKAQSSRLNLLIANAGVMATPPGQTVDGFETQFGVNHLAHFLLIQLLLPTLMQSSTAGFASRVILLSSLAHRAVGVDLENLDSKKGEYIPYMVYSQSKTANIYTANELERRYGGRGVHAWSVHPGVILTGLMQHLDEETMNRFGSDPKVLNVMKNPEQGASTTVWAATADALEGQGGKYLEDCGIAKPAKPDADDFDCGYAPHAYDEAKEKELWERSLEMVKPFLT